MSTGTAAHVVLEDVVRAVGRPARDALVDPGAGGQVVPWAELFHPAVVDAAVDQHARRTGAPPRLAGTFAATGIVSALARLQAWSLTLLGTALVVRPDDVVVQVDDGAVQARIGFTRVDVASGDDAAVAAGAALDTLVVRSAADLSGAGRVSGRLLACDAAFSWLWALRTVGEHLGGRLPKDVLRSQWRSRWPLDDLAQETRISGPDGAPAPYLVRRVCCLQYRLQPPGERVYCPSCPLFPLEVLVARRERVARGERPPPLGDGDRRAPSTTGSALPARGLNRS